MKRKYHIKFKREGEDTAFLKTYDFDDSMTIREMLTSYLRQTNSIITLDPNKIFFKSNTILNNKEQILNKTLLKHFKNLENIIITIHETENIIGGNANIYYGNIKKFDKRNKYSKKLF